MTASVDYTHDAFRKLLVDSNPPITVKQEQEEAVNSLINGKCLCRHADWFWKEIYFSTVLYGREAKEIVWLAHRSWKLPFTSNRTVNLCCSTACSNNLNFSYFSCTRVAHALG